jgi:hypothetical protein
MTIRYKSETFDLTTTNVTTILTCPGKWLKNIKNITNGISLKKGVLENIRNL